MGYGYGKFRHFGRLELEVRCFASQPVASRISIPIWRLPLRAWSRSSGFEARYVLSCSRFSLTAIQPFTRVSQINYQIHG
jgi:hypothetical protein